MKALTIEQMIFLADKGLSITEVISFAEMGAPKSKAAERTARWRARKNGTVTENVTRDGHGDASPPPIEDHTPPVSSDEETRPPRKSKAGTVAKPEGVAVPVWRDFLRQRKTAVTETALDGMIAEARKAGWTLNAALAEAVSRGWQSFKAEWVETAKPPGQPPANDLVSSILRKQQAHAP